MSYQKGQGVISLTKNATHHVWTNHIDVQHHFVWERLENVKIMFEYCPMENMVANLPIKELSKNDITSW
jgi:hypothetical protein